jgi:glycosyltransferase involved in cell wall biosynthesis
MSSPAVREGEKVSLVATVKDAAAHVAAFLRSIEAQTRPPDEVVIVDGGSTDGTLEILRATRGITLIEEPGANIARGRNAAVRAASHGIVAVSDADCVLTPEWLERIVRPIADGADVSMGIYRPLVNSFFEACSAAISIKEPHEIESTGWMPSARSVAFRREMFERAGGYPEWMTLGEDMYLNLRWRQLGARMDLAPDAVVLWRPRPTVSRHWRQFTGYAEYDARGGMYTGRHALRFGVYAVVLGMLASRRPPLLAMAVGAGTVYVARPIRRAWHLLPHRGPRAAAVAAVPALMLMTDIAKMVGYSRGLFGRSETSRPGQGRPPAWDRPAAVESS